MLENRNAARIIEGMNEGSISLDEPPPGAFRTRIEALQVRVNKAALALHERNVRPTVQRIRTALGGGSPNDLAPALKKWRDEVLPALKTADDTPVGVPPLIADIVRELWTRALAAAAVEAVGGAKARRAIAQTEEVATLRGEIDRLRDQLEREQQVVGQLREARARAEAIMSDALTRIEDAERRERRLNAQIGLMRERTPMVASVRQAAPVTRRPRTSKRPKRAHRPASRKKGKSPKLPKKLP
ncbi:MAG: DNA-binding protein, partial [Proteobacteria bacterium]|nr:DNA-binding protein [Pseudomonadota bacterium]